MARSLRLRRWQRDALDLFTARDKRDFLAVATPGAGKTTFALTAARQAVQREPMRVVVVAPTQHLKGQWADAAETFGLILESAWVSGQGGLPADVHGLVTTYQQVAKSPDEIRAIAQDAFVILDEIHHAGDDRAWGDAVSTAFSTARERLSLSGTPFRSDTLAIPFVHYDEDGLATADFDYGYAAALKAGGVVRPVHFPRMEGEMEWVGADGLIASASFADKLDRTGSAARLRTALSTEGEWLPHVLGEAHRRLMTIRETHTDAGGLVIATDQKHARSISDIMSRRLGVRAVVALSEDADASDRITRFAEGSDPWIIAVRMVSEGVDIPRLRVGVFATTTTTELFFRQAVGRIARWIRGLGPQPAYMFVPDDPRLRHHVINVAEQRRHSLRRQDDEGDGPAPEPDPAALDELVGPPARDEDQLSLFQPVSATPTGEAEVHSPFDTGLFAQDVEDDGLLIEFPDVEHLPPVTDDQVRPRERRRRLRDANAATVRQLSRERRLSHAHVNAELNRAVGITQIGEATLEQLEARHRAAERWLVGLPLKGTG